MSNSTVYDVKIQYSLDDRASRGLAGLSASADETAKHVEGLNKGFSHLVELLIGREALRKGKELFVDFNAEMEQTKISMAAITSYNLNVPFDRARVASNALIQDWFKFSERTVLTGKQIVDFGSNVEGAALAAGASLREVSALTKQGAVVGNVLSAGHAGGLQYVGMEVREALMGNLRKTQMFNQQLLAPYMKSMGKSVDEFNKMDAHRRLEIYMAALNSPAWKAAIDAQAGSYLGTLSTLEHKVQILGGQIGESLTGALAKQFKEINDWLNEHPKELEAFATSFSSSLISAFSAIKDTIKFIVDHKTAIMTLGALMLARQGGSMLAGLGGGMGSAFGKDTQFVGFAAMAKESGSFVTEIGKMTTAMTMAAGYLTVFYLGLQKIADWIDEKQAEDIKGRGGDAAVMIDSLRGRQKLLDAENEFLHGSTGGKELAAQLSGTVIQQLRRMGAFNDADFTVDKDKLTKGITALGYSTVAGGKGDQFVGMAFEAARVYAETHRRKIASYGNTKPEGDPLDIKGRPAGKNGNTYVNINKIEVASDDPDRFVVGMTKAFERVNKNPTQAEQQIRGAA